MASPLAFRSAACAVVALAASFGFARASRAQCPPEPTNLHVTADTCSVSLSWDWSAYAVAYRVYRSTSPSSPGAAISTLPTSGSSTGRFTDIPPALPTGQSYYYRVAGVSDACTGAQNEGPRSAPLPAVPVALTAPALYGISAGCNSISFSWNYIPGASGYRVSALLQGVQIAEYDLSTAQLSFSRNQFLGDIPDNFSVAAVGTCANGPPSFVGAGPRALAGNLTGITIMPTCGGIQGSWAAPPAYATGIRVTRTAPGQSPFIFQLPPGATSFFDPISSQFFGTTFTYAITPFNTCGNAGTTSVDVVSAAALTAPALLPPVRVAPNQTASLAVIASAISGSPPINYQWMRNGVPLADGGRIQGSTTATLTITNVRPEDADIYQLVASIPGCSATSTGSLVVPVSCRADFDLDGVLDVQDLFDFLDAWFAGC